MFEGLSRKHALRLLSNTDDVENYYAKNRRQISNTVFRDAFYSFKFWNIMADVIKKTHQTLGYILRSQYRHSNEVYAKLYAYFQDNKDSSVESVTSFILSLPKECMEEYFSDVYNFLLFPIVNKYGIYSPSLILLLFLDMINVLIESYILKGWKHKASAYMNTYMKHMITEHEIHQCPWMNQFKKSQIIDEIEVFKRLQANHFNNRI